MTLFRGTLATALGIADCVASYARGISEILTGRFSAADRSAAAITRCVLKASSKLVSGMSLAGVERVEERLELRLVRMIADVAAIEHLHRQLAPCVPVQAGELLRVKLVVEHAALAADEVGVEVVRLQAIDDRGAFADGAVLELQERRRCGRVFVCA